MIQTIYNSILIKKTNYTVFYAKFADVKSQVQNWNNIQHIINRKFPYSFLETKSILDLR